jgi:hypothetical protein
MALARKGNTRDVYRDIFCLTGGFKVADMYNPENPGHYARAMYGKQLREFHQKFFVGPLDRGNGHQTIGAVWSSHSGESEGRGFGKSMMMSEESKRVNLDFGANILREFDVRDEDVAPNSRFQQGDALCICDRLLVRQDGLDNGIFGIDRHIVEDDVLNGHFRQIEMRDHGSHRAAFLIRFMLAARGRNQRETRH